MHSRLLGAFLVALSVAASAQQSERWSVTVGDLRDFAGNEATATVVNTLRGPQVMLYVRDRTGIRSGAMFMEPAELQRLRAVLERAQAAVDAAAGAQAAKAMAAAASAAKH